MSNNTLAENFTELYDAVKDYTESRIVLWKVEFLEKLTKVSTYLITTSVVLFMFMAALVFLGFAFSFWYSQYHGSIIEGFLISGGIFVLLAIIAYFFRRQLFSNNIVKNISGILFSEDNNHEPIEK